MKHTQKPFMAELQKSKRSNGNPYTAATASAATAPAAALAGPVTVDNSEVLKAIQEVGAKLDRFLTMDVQQIEQIQTEVADISGRIKATKVEMAALRHPLAGEDRFVQASQELSAVVSSTEAATNTIMGCAEELEEIVNELKASSADGYQKDRLGDMHEVVVRIYEACNFQDLTGQRITKVVRALSFIEERIESMMNLWNRREFEAMPLPPSVTKMDGELELHGPSEETQSGNISQADIDALFA
ncbi:MAG TPA: hypothetical protein VD978_13580 [Azospirillum sp.]|nr:hypothetical protein [Azospirillum sp.]